MTITLTSTTQIVEVKGVQARLWKGETATGIPVHCLITRIAVENDHDTAQFAREFQTCTGVARQLGLDAFPPSFVL